MEAAPAQVVNESLPALQKRCEAVRLIGNEGSVGEITNEQSCQYLVTPSLLQRRYTLVLLLFHGSIYSCLVYLIHLQHLFYVQFN